MTNVSPYRARPGAISTVVVRPFVLPRRVLAFFGALFAIPLLLHVFLWSRVVTVSCAREAGERVFCDVDETSIALSNRSRQDATGALRADVRGEVYRTRGDMWIVLIDRRGETDLTSGFNGDKTGQQAAADALTAFLQSRGRGSVTITFGSRWLAGQIFLTIYAILLLVLYPIFGQTLRATADRSRDTMELRRRLWPLPSTRVVLPVSRVARFVISSGQPRRYRLAAVTDDGQHHPLTWPVGTATILAPAAEALTAWAEKERASYRSTG
ncbi:MAG: hypothetical protein U0441_19105 [Polyangiaceae bacterium]